MNHSSSHLPSNVILTFLSLLVLLLLPLNASAILTDNIEDYCSQVQCPAAPECPSDSQLTATSEEFDDLEEYDDLATSNPFIGVYIEALGPIQRSTAQPQSLELESSSKTTTTTTTTKITATTTDATRAKRDLNFLSLPMDEPATQKNCCNDYQCVCKQCILHDLWPNCAAAEVAVELTKALGTPGSCCGTFVCTTKLMCGAEKELLADHYWSDACTRCRCFGGEELCEDMCDKSPKQQPEPQQQDEGKAAANCYSDYLEKLMLEGATWLEDAYCSECSCMNGEKTCITNFCAAVECENPIKVVGKCCPICQEELHEEKLNATATIASTTIASTTTATPTINITSDTTMATTIEAATEETTTETELSETNADTTTEIWLEETKNVAVSSESTAATSLEASSTMSTTTHVVAVDSNSSATATSMSSSTMPDTAVSTSSSDSTAVSSTASTIFDDSVSTIAALLTTLSTSATIVAVTSIYSTEGTSDDLSSTMLDETPTTNAKSSASSTISSITYPTTTSAPTTSSSTTSSPWYLIFSSSTTSNTNTNSPFSTSFAYSTYTSSPALASTAASIVTATTDTTTAPLAPQPLPTSHHRQYAPTFLSTDDYYTSTNTYSANSKHYNPNSNPDMISTQQQTRPIFEELDVSLIIKVMLPLGIILAIVLVLIIRQRNNKKMIYSTKNEKKSYSIIPSSERSLSQTSTNTVLTV